MSQFRQASRHQRQGGISGEHVRGSRLRFLVASGSSRTDLHHRLRHRHQRAQCLAGALLQVVTVSHVTKYLDTAGDMTSVVTHRGAAHIEHDFAPLQVQNGDVDSGQSISPQQPHDRPVLHLQRLLAHTTQGE